ncbi:hypothetical protein E1263_25270 [Kribbella antibiotica]|uniref:Uncharacterized protein n=1 Tax=Kribbella antibiotica TaxID=190195 RepID=A0A4R4ZFK4_9ACTN|nr:hypothetical protein [Kribbella antibiotica]TDD56354.1 hypothetical protein E1263_25270 [Kribbella antibiotica]
MIRRVLLATVLTAALAACGSSADEPQAQPSATFEVPGATTPVTPSALPPSSPPASTPAPSTPAFPSAKDGQNYKACNDGNCEVLIRKTAVITLNGEKNTATVKDGGVRLASKTGYVSLGGLGGAVSWSSNGPTHMATLKAAEGDTVIIVIKTRR